MSTVYFPDSQVLNLPFTLVESATQTKANFLKTYIIGLHLVPLNRKANFSARSNLSSNNKKKRYT
jgi:hypothetical protein